jgi:hypothetical protein
MNTLRKTSAFWPWIALCATALLLSVTPAAVWPDLSTRYDTWENWYQIGRSTKPDFTVDNPPPALRRELRLFQALVIPPGFAAKLLNGVGTEYALPWVNSDASTEMIATFPPLAMFLQHLRYAFPFWLVLLLCTYEGFRLLLREKAAIHQMDPALSRTGRKNHE